MNKDIRKALQPYLAAGATLLPGSKHHTLQLPNGRRIRICSTPSDSWRGIRNLQAELRRKAQLPTQHQQATQAVA